MTSQDTETLLRMIELAKKATPGPVYTVVNSHDKSVNVAVVEKDYQLGPYIALLKITDACRSREDAAFIEAAYNAIPALERMLASQGAEPKVEEVHEHGPECHKLRGEARELHIHRHDCTTAWDFYHRHALGSLGIPSCFGCGKQEYERGVQHLELADIYLCKSCQSKLSAPPLAEPAAGMDAESAAKEILAIVNGVAESTGGRPLFAADGIGPAGNILKTFQATISQHAPAVQTGEGFVVVPVEPTEEMKQAANKAPGPFTPQYFWSVMIAAAPKAGA